ncbi:MAG: hypothetical protein PVF56_23325 [Desulfobacterales bacterium]|jgi:hypothetical protein
MVLGSFVQGMTYPKSVYYATNPYGFFYFRHSLALPFAFWKEADFEWLGYLYGLSFEKKVIPKGMDRESAWKEYLDRVEGYLRQGVPVQTYLGWTPKKKEEREGKIVAPSGIRAFWWEGLTKKFRPDTHSFVVVGMDRSADKLWINAPVAGWRGMEKYLQRPLSNFKSSMERLRPELRYITMVYLRTGKPQMDEKTIQELVRERIVKKIKGDAAAYTKEPKKRYLYGISALEGLRDDLSRHMFFRILRGRMKKQGITSLEVLVWLKLSLFQHTFMTSLAAEYLESQRMMRDWEWLSELNILYHRLYISSVKLVSIVRSNDEERIWAEKSDPVLKDMRGTIGEIIEHMQRYDRKGEV